LPKTPWPMEIGNSKWALVQVSIGLRHKTLMVDKGPSGASRGTGAGGRGKSVGQAVMITHCTCYGSCRSSKCSVCLYSGLFGHRYLEPRLLDFA
jgi:hypothetical protein